MAWKDRKRKTVNMVEMKVFGLFNATEVKVEDPGLKKVINLSSKLMLKSLPSCLNFFANSSAYF